MRSLRACLARLAGAWPSARRERELAAELESHLQMHVDERLRAGVSPEEARREAVLKLGGVEQTKEAYRERAGLPFLDHAVRDARFAARQLARSPGFTVTALVVLALATGAGVAMFAFVDAALLRPLPYRDPRRLVSVAESTGSYGGRTPLSYADYLDWERRSRTLASLEVFTGEGHLLDAPEGALLVAGARVSAGFFRTLGIAPALGRDFADGEDAPGAPAVAILSHGGWQSRFGGRADVVGRTAILSGTPYTIVGVLPRSFQFAPRGRAEVWVPLQPTRPCEQRRSCHNLGAIGRLREGASATSADAELKAIAAALEREYPDSNRGQGASVIALSEAITGQVGPVLLLLLGGASLLLVIAAVNVASLFLLRAERRGHEIAVRHALGASRARLFAQFVAESLVVVSVGCGLGVALGAGVIRLLVGLVPDEMAYGLPFLRDLGLDPRVLGFAGAFALAAAVLFSLAPVARWPLARVRDGLAVGGRAATGSPWRRFASPLVVVELALAVVLLVGAGLAGRSLHRLLQVEPGFVPENVVTLRIAAPPARYDTPAESTALVREVVRRVRELPGVEGAAVTSRLPILGNGNTDWIRFVGRPYAGEHNEVNQRDVGAEYFDVLRARLVRGRAFNDAEDASKPPVVVVNRALVRIYFGEEEPLGKQIGDTSLSPDSIKEIVGVVDDIKEGGLDSETWPAVYYPFNQHPEPWFSLVVRTRQPGPAVLGTLRAEIRGVDPSLGTFDEATMADRIGESPAAYLRRSSAWVIGGFAALASLLSVVGLYGVVAYVVTGRSREMGLRITLGARRRAIYGLVLRGAAGVAAAGVGAGLAAALLLAGLMRPVLFETSPWDVPTLCLVAVTLMATALLASYLPARRAASVDPAIVLRVE